MPKRTGVIVSRVAMLSCLVGVAGCDMKGCRSDNSSGLESPVALAEPVYGSGTISGTVSYDGPMPDVKIVGESDACGEVVDESLVVSADGGLANVLVYLDGEQVVDSTGQARTPAELDQTGCRFVPRVQGVQIQQIFEVANGDPMRHNVRFAPENNERQNLIFATGGTRQSVTFNRPETDPFVVKCDIHPWMTAYVRVFGHPFYATTDTDGRFEIAQVPAGEYDVTTWHELLGERSATLTVGDEVTQLDFTYARPQS